VLGRRWCGRKRQTNLHIVHILCRRRRRRGGAYASRSTIPVIPGNTYNLTVPAAAVAANSGTATNGLRIDGSAVTFTNGSGVTVTASGGQGGACVINPGVNTSGDAGIASTVGSEGDVMRIGGNGAKATTAGQSGGGGGGAGDANPGGNAVNTTAGTGGVAGGGNGGTGRSGDAAGGLGLNAGGGGGGGRSQNSTTIDFRAGGNGGLGRVTISYFSALDDKLVITSVPGSATAGTDFSVTIQAQDSGGTPVGVTQDTEISLAASGSGTLTGNIGTIPAGQNSVTLNFVQYTAAESITLTASRTSGDSLAPSAASSSIVIDPAAASQLVFTTQPSASTESGVPFATQPVVQVQDTFGNLVTTGVDSTATVTLTLTTGTGTLGGTTSMNAVAGVADFAGMGLNIDLPGTDKVLTATAGFGSGVSNPFAITATPLTWSATRPRSI
jgi:hypothetical protein